MTPSVSFHYEPSIKNGPLGAGWSLQASSMIGRHGPLGGSPGWDQSDTYRLDGKRLQQDNAVQPGGVIHYLPLHQDGWIFVNENNGLAWTATRDGITKRYGNHSSSICDTNGVVGTEVPCESVRWYLKTEADEFGNSIEYNYDQASSHMPRITQIRYNISGSNDFRIDFSYEGRSDERMDCSNQECRPLDSRLRGVRVSTRVNGVDRAVYHYMLEYTELGPTRQSVLQRVVQKGLDDSGLFDGNDLVLREYGYHDSSYTGTATFASEAPLQVLDETMTAPMDLSPPGVTSELFTSEHNDQASTSTLTQDIDGDALPDLIVFNEWGSPNSPDHRIFLNRPLADGTPRFVYSSAFSTALMNFMGPMKPRELHIADLNQDGYADLIGPLIIQLGTPEGFVEPALVTNFVIGNRQLADINGDGAPDLVDQETWYPNTGALLSGPDFFDTTQPWSLNDPVIDSGVFGNGTDCMAPGMGTEARIPKNELGQSAQSPPGYYPDPDGPAGPLLEITSSSWLWRYTSHADVNGDGLADRIVNVDWLQRDGTKFWDAAPACGRTEGIYLGRGNGAFESTPYNTGGDSTTTSLYNTAPWEYTIPTGQPGAGQQVTYDASYLVPLNHFGLTDIDGDGWMESLNRCRGTTIADPIIVLPHQGRNMGFWCPPAANLGEEVPLDWIGPLPVSGMVSGMVDLNGDGFADGFRGPNYVSDIGPDTGNTNTPWPVNTDLVWRRNQRTESQGWLTSVKVPSGGTMALTWGRSAAHAEDNGPVSLPVLLSVTRSDGHFNFEYAEGNYGFGEFLGWGRIATQRPSGAVEVQTFNTSLALKGRKQTDELYRQDGSLKRIKVYLHGSSGLVAGFPGDIASPYKVGIRRICTFESPDDAASVSANRLEFIATCLEWAGEHNGSGNTAAPEDEPGTTFDNHLQNGITAERLDIRNSTRDQVRSGRRLELIRTSLNSLDPAQTARLESFGHAVKRLRRRYDQVPPASILSTVEAQGRFEAHIDWLEKVARDELEQFDNAIEPPGGGGSSTFVPPDDSMDFGLGAVNVTPVPITDYRFYVTEADWQDVRRLDVVRYYRDVTTREDSRMIDYTYYPPGGGFDGYRLESVTESDVPVPGTVRNIERRVVYHNAGLYPYQGSKWTLSSEVPSEDTVLPDGTVSSLREFKRSYTARGQLETMEPPQGELLALEYGHCGVTRNTRGDSEVITSYDDHCRVVSTIDDAGLTKSYSYDGLRRVVREVDGAQTPTGVLSIDRGVRHFDNDGLPIDAPDEVLLWEHDTGVYALVKTFRDSWGRVTKEEICEWQPVCSDPMTCPWSNRLDTTFACATNSGVHSIRTASFDSEGRLDVRTDWHDPSNNAPPSWSYEYDDLDRRTKLVRPDGSEIQTTRGLTWTITREVNGSMSRQQRTSISTLAKEVESWNPDTNAWVFQRSERFDRYKRVKQLIDASGENTYLTYDGYGRLAKKEDASIRVTQCDGTEESTTLETHYFYNLNDQEGRVRAPDGTETLTTYDGQGRLESIRHEEYAPSGGLVRSEVSLTREYMAGPYPNRRVIETDGNNNELIHWQLAWGQPWKVTMPDGTELRHQYDDQGRPSRLERTYDGALAVRTIEYDLFDRAIRETRQFGSESQAVWTSTYDARGYLTETRDPDGVTHGFTYDALGRPLDETLGNNPSTKRRVSRRAYDDLGRLDWIEQAGDVTKYRYDHFDRITELLEGYDPVANNALVTTKAEYNAGHRLTAIEDGLGVREEFTLNNLGWPTATTVRAANGSVLTTTATGYDRGGRVTREVDEDGLVSCQRHDFMGRVSAVLPPGGPSWTNIIYERGVTSPITGLPLNSETVTVISPLGNFERRYTDGMGRVHLIESPNTLTVSHFDSFGRKSAEDERAASTPGQVLRIRTMDYQPGSPRLWRSSDWVAPSSLATCRQDPTTCPSEVLERDYTLGGRLAILTDGNQQRTHYTYAGDGLGLLTSVAMQDITTRQYTYDATFPVVTEMLEGGATPIRTAYTLERYHRMQSVVKSRPTVTTTLESDFITYDSLGRVTKADRSEDGVLKSSLRWSYGDLGDLEARAVDLPGKTLGATFAHFKNGRLKSVEYPSGNIANYTYEPGSNRLSQIRLTHATNASIDQLIYDVPQGYDADGRARNIELAPGLLSSVRIEHGYDAATHRLRHRELEIGPAGARQELTENYTFDALGYLTSIDRTIHAGAPPVKDAFYEYNERGFVTFECHANHFSDCGPSTVAPDADVFRYTYDSSGNRVSMTENHGSAQSMTSFGFGNSDRVSTVNRTGLGTIQVAWDEFGRQEISSAGLTLIYNLHHELTGVPGNNETSVYGADGVRVAKTENGQTTYYLPGGDGHVLETEHPGGAIEDNIFVGDDVVAQVGQNSEITSVVIGVEGNPILIAPNGSISWRPLNAWGLDRDGGSLQGPELGFHQMQTNIATGLSHAGVRVYDQLLGRFTTPDPIGFEGGSTDLYRYGFNNPVRFQDRNGQLARDEKGSYFVTCSTECFKVYVRGRSNDDPLWDVNDKAANQGFGLGGKRSKGEEGSGKTESKNDNDDGEEIEEEGGRVYVSAAFEGEDSEAPGQSDAGDEGEGEVGEQASEAAPAAPQNGTGQEGGPTEKQKRAPGTTLTRMRLAMASSPVDSNVQDAERGLLGPSLDPQSKGLSPNPGQPKASQIGRIASQVGLNVLDSGIDLVPIPFLSSFKEAANLIAGRNVITGEEYTTFDYTVGIISVGADVFTAGVAGGYVAVALKTSKKGIKSAGKALDAIESARSALKRSGCKCFVESVRVATPSGSVSIRDVRIGSRVIASKVEDAGAVEKEPWVEIESSAADAGGPPNHRGVCELIRAWAPRWALPGMVALAACDTAPKPPGENQVIEIYDGPSDHWEESVGAELEVGATWVDHGHLWRWTNLGIEDRGEVTVAELGNVDATWVANSAIREPKIQDWASPIRDIDPGGIVLANSPFGRARLPKSDSELNETRDGAAAASTNGVAELWVEVEDAPVEERGAWAPRGVCDRVTAWTPKWAMPAMVALAACGVEPEFPAADEVVQVYDARTGDWSEALGAELEVGDMWFDDGRLLRWTDDGVEDRGEATVEELTEADATWTAEAATRVPGTDDWVLVIGEADQAGHWKLGAVEAGERFAFQGRVFETADADGDGLIEVRSTGDVLGRVYETHVRQSDVVIDLVVTRPGGSETITGTPEHPFWVPEVGDYVAMADLEVGTVLRTVGGGEARVASMNRREGDFEVFNFEVEGSHNYYVRAPAGDGDGVLVHNGCGDKVLGKFDVAPGVGRGGDPSRRLPRTKHGDPVPDTNLPHTPLGVGRDGTPQARTWEVGSNGNLQPTRDIDFGDHGFPDDHTNPHQHKYTPANEKLAPKGGMHRGLPEPVEPLD
ncbi:MAG: RHS repeat-associated core domain-containing protein [Myxococcota bacterium]